MAPYTTLHSTDEVIDALGGTAAVARLMGRVPQAVSNWRTACRGRFPPETFIALQAALEAAGYSAPPALWGMERRGGSRPERSRVPAASPA